jgi:protein-S-isoprenylcysteine O-methyltransferase Ste14
MYTSFYLLVAAFFLLSANGLIGLAWFGGLTVVMVTRIAREEAVMQEKFGDAYRAYIHQTGRFLPRLGA